MLFIIFGSVALCKETIKGGRRERKGGRGETAKQFGQSFQVVQGGTLFSLRLSAGKREALGAREGASGVSFCGCLTTMGEQSDARFRWQEIELHEHAKLHHFGTTVNNFPFTWRRRSIFRDVLLAVGLCRGKTRQGRG